MATRQCSPETPDRLATYQDVLDAPPHRVAEIVAGTLHVQPRPGSWPAFAKTTLACGILIPVHARPRGPGSWRILLEPELHLGQDILVPDIAAWCRETMPVFPDVAYFEIVPDWICEVLSPTTRRLDLTGKRDAYAREGVAHLWFVDPEARILEAFELRSGAWTLIDALANDAPVALPPFEVPPFSLAELWPDTPTRSTPA